MFKVVVHLVDGSTAKSKASDVTEEESESFRELMKDIAGSKPNDGWQIDIESENGSWAVFPRSSVLYVELERVSE